jgi:hypothetical protein
MWNYQIIRLNHLLHPHLPMPLHRLDLVVRALVGAGAVVATNGD